MLTRGTGGGAGGGAGAALRVAVTRVTAGPLLVACVRPAAGACDAAVPALHAAIATIPADAQAVRSLRVVLLTCMGCLTSRGRRIELGRTNHHITLVRLCRAYPRG
jgi:hypothetical protein